MSHLPRAWVRRVLSELRIDERGFSTAELLGNAALAIVALIVIWAALEALGVEVIDMVRDRIGV